MNHNIVIARSILRELFTSKCSPRVPEPDLIMENDESVTSFNEASKNALVPLYLYNTLHTCDLIRPNDKVIDLCCGPANQLCMIADIHPDASFIGVDLSKQMLEIAHDNATQQQLKNISFNEGNVCDLNFVEDNSVDVVISTLAFHHLPDVLSLDKVFAEMRRILKHDGVVYIMDFAHMKSEKSIEEFAFLDKGVNADIFIEDYYNSLRAAFYFDDWKKSWHKYLASYCRIKTTFPVPFFVVCKSLPRSTFTKVQKDKLQKIYTSMSERYKNDFKSTRIFMGLDNATIKKALK